MWGLNGIDVNISSLLLLLGRCGVRCHDGVTSNSVGVLNLRIYKQDTEKENLKHMS